MVAHLAIRCSVEQECLADTRISDLFVHYKRIP